MGKKKKAAVVETGPQNGVHYGLSREAYDAIRGRVNWSRLKVMGLSPQHYRHALFADDHDSDAKRLGRCAHMAVLEPEVFPKACAIWTGGRRAGAEWQAFVEANEGRELLKEEEVTFCRALQAAVRNDAHAKKFLEKGRAEVTVLATLHGRGFKTRPDFISEGEKRAIVDLKTTRDASPDGFAREVWRMHYEAQAAVYQDAWEAATGELLPVVIIAVEKDPPHAVQTYVVPPPVIDAGRFYYRGLLEKLVECERTQKWPGYVDGIAELRLPPWATLDDDANDLTGMDLVFQESA